MTAPPSVGAMKTPPPADKPISGYPAQPACIYTLILSVSFLGLKNLCTALAGVRDNKLLKCTSLVVLTHRDATNWRPMSETNWS